MDDPHNATPLTPDELVTQHVDRVRALALLVRGRARRQCPNVELGDLIAWGMEALIVAARRFDPAGEATFSTFASLRIRGAMLDGLRRAQRVADREAEASDLEALAAPGSSHHELRLRTTLASAIARLPAMHQSIVRAHYIDGLSIVSASRRLGVSKRLARRVHAEAIRALREKLAA